MRLKAILVMLFFVGFCQLTVAQTVNTKYYKSGKILSTFYSSGNITERVVYFETGGIKELATFKDNQPHGTWKNFDESGKILKTSFYRDGEKIGVWTVWSQFADEYIEIDYAMQKPLASAYYLETRFE